ncbi:MAG: hypothetical protein NTV22_19310 [bacterium]|nr:hypothetical protein [bacterium]
MRTPMQINVWLSATLLAGALVLTAAPVKIFEDDFNTTHTYWNGTSATPANGWRGVLHGSVSSMIDANTTVPGCLSIQIPSGQSGSAEGGVFTAPALYLSVTGNFIAIVQLHEPLPTENYDNFGIMVFNPNGSINHATLHAFPVAATWASNVVLRITQNGSSSETIKRQPALPWLRLERNGNTFTAACKAQDADPWIEMGNNSAAFLPAVVNVGPFAANYNSSDADVYSFERFELWQEQNPALTLGPDVYRTHLFYSQTGTFAATLRNDGTDPATWNAVGAPAWLSLAPDSGVLAPGAATSIVFHLLTTGMATPQMNTATVSFNNPGVIPVATVLMSVGPETNEIVLFDSGFEAAEGYGPGSVYAVPGWKNWGPTNQAFVVDEKPASGAHALKVFYTGARNYFMPGPECAFPVLSDGIRSGRLFFQCKMQVQGPDTLTVYPNLVGAPPAFMPGCLKFQAGNAGAMGTFMLGNQTSTDTEVSIDVPGGVTRDVYHDVAFQYDMADRRIVWAAIDASTQAWSDLLFLRSAYTGASATDTVAWLGFAVGYYFSHTNVFGDWAYFDDVKVTWLTDKYPALVATPDRVSAWMEVEQSTTMVVRLNNAGDIGTAWYCTSTTDAWLTLSQTNGYLAPGAATTITAGVHAVRRGILDDTLVFHSAADTLPATRITGYVISPAVVSTLLDDHFDQPYVYYADDAIAVTGTAWSGVLHAGYATQIVAHSEMASHLMLMNKAGLFSGLENNEDTAPALYRAVTGSFDATLLLGDWLPPVQWETPGLLACDPDGANPNSVFVASFAVNNRMLTRSTINGASTTVVADGVQHWVRLLRDEDVFWTFSRATNASTWRVLAAFERPDLPQELWVGPFSSPFNDLGSEYFFDRCRIDQRETIPEPYAVAVAVLAWLAVRWRTPLANNSNLS